ncbi:MAG: hypothetical protein ACP5N7_01185 [Candidatus Pacearchaeota archaeon]
MSIIKNKDIYDPSQGNPFEPIIKILELLDSKIEETKKKIIGLESSIKSFDKSSDSKGVKKLINDTEALSAETKKLIELEKSNIEINKQLEVANQKLAEAQNEYAKELEKVKIETQIVKKTKKEDAELTSEVVGAYRKLSIEYNRSAKATKDLIIQYGKNSKEAQESAKATNLLRDRLYEADKTVQQFTRNVGNYEGALIPVKKQLMLLIAEMSKMKAAGNDNTQAYREMAIKAGHLKDSIEDARAEVKLFASDTRRLDMAVSVFKAIGSAAQIAEGAAALLGQENEELTRSIQKMVAIQSILNGVTEIQNALQKESAFMQTVMAIQTKIVTAAQWLWNAALSANPIGAVIIAITALVSGIIALTRYFEDNEKQLIKERTALDGVIYASREAAEAHNEHIRAMKSLDREMEVLIGTMTDFEAELLNMGDAYYKELDEIDKETETKLTKAGGFWNKLWTGIKSGGNSYITIGKLASETADIVGDAAKLKADKEEEFQKKIDLLTAKNQEKEREKQKQKEKDEAEAYKRRLEKAKEFNDKMAILAKERFDREREIESAQGEQYAEKKEKEIEQEIGWEEKELASIQAIREKYDDKEIKRTEQRLADYKKGLEVQEELTKQLFVSIGEIIGTAISGSNDALKEAAKSSLLFLLKQAEAFIDLILVQILAKEILGKGIVGIATTAILKGIIKGAFKVIAGNIQTLATGTDYVNGPGTGTSDSINARLSKGEGVINAKNNMNLLRTGIGVNDKRLPGIVNAGLSTLAMESKLSSIENHLAQSNWYLSNFEMYHEDKEYKYIKDIKTGITHKIVKA